MTTTSGSSWSYLSCETLLPGGPTLSNNLESGSPLRKKTVVQSLFSLCCCLNFLDLSCALTVTPSIWPILVLALDSIQTVFIVTIHGTPSLTSWTVWDPCSCHPLWVPPDPNWGNQRLSVGVRWLVGTFHIISYLLPLSSFSVCRFIEVYLWVQDPDWWSSGVLPTPAPPAVVRSQVFQIWSRYPRATALQSRKVG